MNNREIAEQAWKQIVKCNAQAIWQIDAGLWIPDEYFPMTHRKIDEISVEIAKIAKGENNGNNT
jgi:hypothetical protein